MLEFDQKSRFLRKCKVQISCYFQNLMLLAHLHMFRHQIQTNIQEK